MDGLLALTAGLPELALEPGEVLVREGEAGGGLWILLDGLLQVRKGDVDVNTISRPGSAIGEISLLLDAPCSATVVAASRTTLRHAADGAALLASDPAITRLIAAGLAERLHVVTSYLADLKHQYGEAPGLTMVSDVLHQLAHRQAFVARPGSAREPNPDY